MKRLLGIGWGGGGGGGGGRVAKDRDDERVLWGCEVLLKRQNTKLALLVFVTVACEYGNTLCQYREEIIE